MKLAVKCDYCGNIFNKYPSQIGNHNFCSTVCYHEYTRVPIPEEQLRMLYLEQELSIREVAKKLGVSGSVVLGRIKDYGIPVRGSSEAISISLKGRSMPWLEDTAKPTQFKKGDIPWNKGLTAETDERVRRSGEKVSEAYEERLPRANTKITLICESCGKEFKVKYFRGDSAKYCSPECSYEARRGRKQWWAEKRIKAVMRGIKTLPTKPERTFMKIVEENDLPYVYNSIDVRVIVERRVPDFYNINKNKEVIEIFGRAFHDPSIPNPFPIPYGRTYEGTMEHYEKHGYKCIIFWEDELNDERKILKELVLW